MIELDDAKFHLETNKQSSQKQVKGNMRRPKKQNILDWLFKFIMRQGAGVRSSFSNSSGVGWDKNKPIGSD